MAQRRMFEREIMELDDFVDMPTSTRLLYVYINLDADDEGFLGSPKKIMRAFGGSSDDMKILIAKGFLIAHESGVIVVTHWHEHNKLRKDRIKPTRYLEEKQTLELVENQWVQPSVNQVSTKCQTNDRLVEVSIGEVSIVKDSIDTVREKSFESFWNLYNLKKNKIKTKKLFMALSDVDFNEMVSKVRAYIGSTNTDGSYPSRVHPTTYLNSTNKMWRDEIEVITNNNSMSGAEKQTAQTAERYGVWTR